MSAQTTPAQGPAHRTRNARLADWIARNESVRLHAVAKRYGVPRDELDDIVQAALGDFLRSFPGPYDQAHALSYTFRCVQNRALKYFRWYARRRAPIVDLSGDAEGARLGDGDGMDSLPCEHADTLERVLEREDYLQRLDGLSQLPRELREIATLRAMGYAPTEIGTFTGLSHRAVRKRIERANRLLRFAR